MPELEPYKPPERPDEKPAGNILELLDRILDKGIVIVGDIRISVADIELLKVQIRLLIASVDKAKELGIDFSWAKQIEQTKTKGELEEKVQELESILAGRKPDGSQIPSPQNIVSAPGEASGTTVPENEAGNDTVTDSHHPVG